MGNVYEDRPEIGRASAAYRLEQLEAFCRLEPDLCGVRVRPFTPRIAMELELAGNKFITGGIATAEDIVQFVHRVSVRFHPASAGQVARITKQLFQKVVAPEIEKYLERVYAVAPPKIEKEGHRSAGDGCSLAYLVHIFGTHYGWSVDEVLDTPYRILWQLLHRMIEDRDPDYVQQSPEAARIKHEYLARQQAELEAANAAKGRN